MSGFCSRFKITVYLKQDLDAARIDKLKEMLEGVDGVHRVTFMPPDVNLRLIESKIGKDFSVVDLLGRNPLPPVFKLEVKEGRFQWIDQRTYYLLARKIRSIDGVEKVLFNEWAVKTVSQASTFLNSGIFYLGGFLVVFVVLFLILCLETRNGSLEQEIRLRRRSGEKGVSIGFFIMSLRTYQGMLGGASGILGVYLVYRFLVCGFCREVPYVKTFEFLSFYEVLILIVVVISLLNLCGLIAHLRLFTKRW
jgi:cell division protein FtsX